MKRFVNSLCSKHEFMRYNLDMTTRFIQIVLSKLFKYIYLSYLSISIFDEND